MKMKITWGTKVIQNMRDKVQIIISLGEETTTAFQEEGEDPKKVP